MPREEPDPEMMPVETRTDVLTEFTEIEQLARDLCGAGDAARKITILGTAEKGDVTLTVLTLARLIARDARVVVVDLGSTSAFAATSIDPAGPAVAGSSRERRTSGLRPRVAAFAAA
jgi:hypothetical protein